MASMDQVAGADEAGHEVVIARQGGLVVLQGPKDVIARLAADDPALRSARTTQPSRAAAGALAHLATHAPGSGSAVQAVFTLDDVGLKLYQQGQLADGGEGFLRLFGRAADGTFSAHGAIKPLMIAPQELLTAQLALTTLALTASIKAVQEAVERVEDKVDLLADLVDSTRVGDVVGAHRSLTRRAERATFHESLADTDWHAIDDVGIQVEQQIEALRSFVRKRLVSAEAQGVRISGRREALDDVRELSEALSLLVVAQDSLFLFQQLRLTRIRDAEPLRLEHALAESRQLMDEHLAEDGELLARVREVVADRVTVKALEIHRAISARAVVRTAGEVNGMLAWFAEQRSMTYDPIEVPALPGLDDMVDEIRDRGEHLVTGGRRAARMLTSRVKAIRSDELEAGDVQQALTDGLGDEDEPGAVEPPERDLRSRLRGRLGRRSIEEDQPTVSHEGGDPEPASDGVDT